MIQYGEFRVLWQRRDQSFRCLDLRCSMQAWYPSCNRLSRLHTVHLETNPLEKITRNLECAYAVERGIVVAIV